MRLRCLLVAGYGLLIGFAGKVVAQGAATAPTIYQPFEVDSAAGAARLQLESYLATHLRKPFMAQVKNISGRVILKGIVEPDGRFSEVAVQRGLRPDCDREALRVMRLFNFWRPALKAGKPVRQAITTAVLFRANAPVYLDGGNSLTYYDANGWVSAPETARQVIIVPTDTLTGLPTGDMRVCRVSGGGGGGAGKETDRFLFVRQAVAPQGPDDAPKTLIGHQQDGNWIGTVYTLRADGSLLQTESADPATGSTTRYARTGQVAETYNHETKNRMAYYPGGQPRQVQLWIAAEPTNNVQGRYRVETEWDSTTQVTVSEGNGRSVNQELTTSRRNPDQKTLFTETGMYQNGLRSGIWTGQAADSSYHYEERYEQGKCLGGTAITNGVATTYEDAQKNPEFDAGQEGLYSFLGQHITYPAEAQRAGVGGKVYVGFTVCTDGSLCDFQVMRGVHPALDKEALRVTKRMSNRWKPGLLRGKPVRVRYNLPILFTLN